MPYQYESLTKRRPGLNYADIITAEAPTAKKRYYDQKSLGLEEDALAQNREQFNQQYALEKDRAEAQRESAEQTKRTSSAGAGAAVGAYVAGGTAAGGPVGAVVGAAVGYAASNWSHMCTAIKDRHPGIVFREDMKLMIKLRNWISAMYPVWVKFYDESAPVALQNMIEILGESGFNEILSDMHSKIFSDIPVAILMGDMAGAFRAYKKSVLPIILEYAPEFIEAASIAIEKEKDSLIAKAKMPGVKSCRK